MRWFSEPKLGDKRTKVKFAWWPVKMSDGESVMFEEYVVEQEFTRQCSDRDCENEWVTRKSYSMVAYCSKFIIGSIFLRMPQVKSKWVSDAPWKNEKPESKCCGGH